MKSNFSSYQDQTFLKLRLIFFSSHGHLSSEFFGEPGCPCWGIICGETSSPEEGKPTRPTWNRPCTPAHQTTREISGACRSHCQLYNHSFACAGCRHSSSLSDGLLCPRDLLLSSPTLYPSYSLSSTSQWRSKSTLRKFQKRRWDFPGFRMSFVCLWLNKYKFQEFQMFTSVNKKGYSTCWGITSWIFF